MDMQTLKEEISKLTNEQRLELYEDYCKHCGVYDRDMYKGCRCSK